MRPKQQKYATSGPSRLETVIQLINHLFENIQIFERWSGCKIIKQNVPGGYDF